MGHWIYAWTISRYAISLPTREYGSPKADMPYSSPTRMELNTFHSVEVVTVHSVLTMSSNYE